MSQSGMAKKATSLLSLFLLSLLTIASDLQAQVPDGYIVFGSFQGTAGRNGIYFAHPRDTTAPPIEVTGLSADLAFDPTGRRGVACLIRRPSDGALIVGERAAPGHSVDLHVLTLTGNDVRRAVLFSVGTSVAAGEIPQCALLPDGRVLVAATDLAAGPLAIQQTVNYNKQGVGIIDTIGGGVTPLDIPNQNASFNGVINALAVSPDGTVAYIGNYISASSGDIWAVPLPNGGNATLVAQIPTGVSGLGVDLDGTLLVTTLGVPPADSLYRVDPITSTVTPIPTTAGPMNAVVVETVTGNLIMATANSGLPARSLLWRTPTGPENILSSPNLATISTVALNPNPEVVAQGTAGIETLSWRLAPNPGGLPLVGNAAFSLTLDAAPATTGFGLIMLTSGRLPVGAPVLGATVHVNPQTTLLSLPIGSGTSFSLLLPLPNLPALRGFPLFAQSLHAQGSGGLASSPLVEATIL